MRTRHHAVGSLAAALSGCAAVIGCRADGDAGRRESVEPVQFVAMPLVAPLAFFERSCANCHGPFGTFYGETFAATLDNASLVRVVGAMVRGPARSSLDPLSLDALVSFHRALREPATGPFLVVTSVQADTMRGEVSPGAAVNVLLDTALIAAEVDGSEWHVTLPPRRRPGIIVVTARSPASGVVTTVDISKQAFSHTAPNDAPARR